MRYLELMRINHTTSGPGPEVVKLFSCSAQLRLKFILLINIKMLSASESGLLTGCLMCVHVCVCVWCVCVFVCVLAGQNCMFPCNRVVYLYEQDKLLVF